MRRLLFLLVTLWCAPSHAQPDPAHREGIRVVSAVESVFLLRNDTPLNIGLEEGKVFKDGFPASLGVNVFVQHPKVRVREVYLGLQLGYQARELNSVSAGPLASWCPDDYKRLYRDWNERWCPLEGTFVGYLDRGSFGPFSGGLTSMRIGSRFERTRRQLIFNFAVGLGYESYKRSDYKNLFAAAIYVQLGLGTEF